MVARHDMRSQVDGWVAATSSVNSGMITAGTLELIKGATMGPSPSWGPPEFKTRLVVSDNNTPQKWNAGSALYRSNFPLGNHARVSDSRAEATWSSATIIHRRN